MKLYEIVETYNKIMDLELEPEQIKLMLYSANVSLEEKAFDIAKVKLNMQSDIDGLDAEVKRLNNRKKSIKNGLDRLNDYLLDAMLTCSKAKFKNDLITISVRTSKRVITDMELLDQKYINQKIIVTADKTLIKQDLKLGKVKGARLEEHHSLNIK
jgi:hypothetical protein